jgi:hypothetical protein
LSGEVNGYGDAGDESMLEIGDAADFSHAFSSTSTTTGFKVRALSFQPKLPNRATDCP